MSSLGSPNPFFLGGKKAYEVDRSLRFNRDDDAYLQATLGNSDLNKWTLSIWVKKPVNGEHQAIFSSGDSSVSTMVNFGNSDRLKFTNYPGSAAGIYITTRKFRDPSAWYHIVAIWDSGNSTAGDRMRLYVNGVRETAFDQSDDPNQNQNSVINGNTQGDSTWGQGKHRIGRYSNYADNSGCYYAEANFIDGQAYDPSYFAETNVLTGQWNPKKYTGSYGTNGFYLNFSDNSGTTATTLGKDSSGNANNFTPNNFSVSAGAGNDSLEDTPTNNFCTLNPLAGRLTGFLASTNGNLDFAIPAGGTQAWSSFQIPTSGKWYSEWVFTTLASGAVGVGNIEKAQGSSAADQLNGINLLGNEIKVNDSSTQGSLITVNNNDIIGIKVDRDAGTVAFTVNGSASGNAENISSMSAPTDLVFRAYRNASGGSAPTGSVNFGQRPFSYLPTGYKALNSANLPDPTILLPNKHFDSLPYSGAGGTQSVTGLEFQPDWVWLKRRSSGSSSHVLSDSVRGVNLKLASDKQDAEAGTANGTISSFNSNGFTLAEGGGTYPAHETNKSGETYVGWNWNAGDTDSKTYTVKVVSDSGNKYRFNNFGTSAVTLDLAEGGTYIFNMDDATNATHPFSIGTAANGTVYTSGITYFLDGVSKTYSQYTSGFSSATTRRLHITVPASAPVLYYWCSAHSGMGGQINTNSTLGSSNFDGSIQSTAKANTSAGFSIVGYTGTNGTGTIGHGLGVAPRAYIVKRRDNASDWRVYHQSLGNTNALKLNTSDQAYANSSYWNDTSPTSTTVSLGNDSDMNGSTDKYIAYCFSEVAGYSKFGSYVGNGSSSSGPFVFTGFRPALIILKATNSARNWVLMDNKRSAVSGANQNDYTLEANNSNTENTAGAVGSIDMLSNGFKFRGSAADSNGSGNTYIYLAFAEAPFRNARAR